MNLADLAKLVANEDEAIALVESLRWPNGEPICPHCGVVDRSYRLAGKTTRKGLWKCGACRKPFTVRVGTIFEDSHLPLSKWLLAINMMTASKKGVSASQISRQLGIGYKSAWHLCHRIRLAMTKSPVREMLGSDGGIVEIDEVYIGGKAENNKHKDYVAPKKMAVMTLVERDGEARSVHVDNVRMATVDNVILDNVSGNAQIITDSSRVYPNIQKYYWSHRTINHSKEYVRGVVHTNFAESYHSLLKRGILGSYHHVSAKHLHRYLAEFEFRWNSRKATDGARMVEAIQGAEASA